MVPRTLAIFYLSPYLGVEKDLLKHHKAHYNIEHYLDGTGYG